LATFPVEFLLGTTVNVSFNTVVFTFVVVVIHLACITLIALIPLVVGFAVWVLRCAFVLRGILVPLHYGVFVADLAAPAAPEAAEGVVLQYTTLLSGVLVLILV
jgi:hypothetical protein